METLKVAGAIFLAAFLSAAIASCAYASPRIGLPVDISVEAKSDRLPVVIATAFAGLLVYADHKGEFKVSPKPTPRPQIKQGRVMAIIEWKW